MLLIPERWQLLLDSLAELCAAWVHGCPSLLASTPPPAPPSPPTFTLPPHLRYQLPNPVQAHVAILVCLCVT